MVTVNKLKKNFEDVILSMKLGEENYIYKLCVYFEKKGIRYEKNVFIIMTKTMVENLKLNDNIRHFMDVTYYSSPPSKVKYKLFVLLSFNQSKYETILCNLSLIENKNTETFITILSH